MNDSTIIQVKFGNSAPKVTWSRALPRGNIYLYCIRPDRNLAFNERSEIMKFCNDQFGSQNWFMAGGEDYIGFRYATDMEKFTGEF